MVNQYEINFVLILNEMIKAHESPHFENNQFFSLFYLIFSFFFLFFNGTLFFIEKIIRRKRQGNILKSTFSPFLNHAKN